jgi:signal transduction histidine kinase
MQTVNALNAGLAGFFSFAGLHYAVKWWSSRKERVLLVFSIQCVLSAVFSLALRAYFRATTVADVQSALDRFVTIGVLIHAVLLQFYAELGGGRGRAYRVLVTCGVVALAVLNQWAPLGGVVVELRPLTLPDGEVSVLPIRTPPGASLALLYIVVCAIQFYGFGVVGTIWKRDRAAAVLLAVGSAVIALGAVLGFLGDFAHVRAPNAGALPHAVFVLCMALLLSREYAARGARLAVSERRAEASLQEARQALAELRAEHGRREEAEAARRQAMEAVVQAQRKEIASHLAAGVAHDFNNVLNVMSVWSQLLTSGVPSVKEQERARVALADALAQGQALSRQLMALDRPDPRSVKRIRLDGPIKSALQTLESALPRTVRLELEAADAPEVDAAEAEIQQVLYNLVLNARDAMPRGGVIRVTVGVETSPAPLAVVGGTLAAGRWATLSVADSGPGIDPTIREHIFELFFTTKAAGHGTGLGLTTVLRIAKATGGGVALESAPGAGATFKLYLRARERPTASASVTPAPSVQDSP